MYNQNQHLAKEAQSILKNRNLEQEERKAAMHREQRKRELEKFETQLFYKKQEIDRLKSLHSRLAREAVLKQAKQIKEKGAVVLEERKLKDAEQKITDLDKNVNSFLVTINEKIKKEKETLQNETRELELLLNKQKQFEQKSESEKKKLAESLSHATVSRNSHKEEVFNTGVLQEFERKKTQIENEIERKRVEIRNLEVSLQNVSRQIIVEEKRIEQEKTDGYKKTLKEVQYKNNSKEIYDEYANLTKEINEQIKKEKELITAKEKMIQDFEKQKVSFIWKEKSRRNSIMHIISNALFGKKKEEQELKNADSLFVSNQREMHQIDLALKNFSQEVTVLENKIRALQTATKTSVS
jgi:hypothetical protein